MAVHGNKFGRNMKIKPVGNIGVYFSLNNDCAPNMSSSMVFSVRDTKAIIKDIKRSIKKIKRRTKKAGG